MLYAIDEVKEMGEARLCIGLTVYNGERYLAQALESVLSQTFEHFDLVIADNASTDNTGEICHQYQRKDPRIRYFRHQVNVGAGPNFNFAFKKCRSPFFKWMAHDDLLAPDFLRRCVDVLIADDSVALAHPDLCLIDENGDPIEEGPQGKVVDRHGNRHHNREPLHLAEGASAPERFAEVLRKMSWGTQARWRACAPVAP